MTRFGPRFFSMEQVYDFEWRSIALDIAKEIGVEDKVKEGVYTMLGGPCFETPAELRMLQMCGVDAVGKVKICGLIWKSQCCFYSLNLPLWLCPSTNYLGLSRRNF